MKLLHVLKIYGSNMSSNMSSNLISHTESSSSSLMDEYTLVLFLCFSSILLIYMTRFIKPEPDDEISSVKKRYNPYSLFLSPFTITSPFLSPIQTKRVSFNFNPLTV